MRIAITLIALAVVGCANAAARDELAPFRSLKAGMTMEQGRARVGQPSREAGSGLAIDVYRLRDGGEVWLGYAGSYGLIYVKHGEEELLPGGGGSPPAASHR